MFFISGLVLKTEEIKKASSHWQAIIYGLVAILAVTPCLGFLFKIIPLNPIEFTYGLVIFCLVPTTLGIGISLVRTCLGSEAIALFLTIASNIAGIFIMPLWTKALLSSTELDLSIDIPDLLAKLVIAMLVPSLVGKGLRELFTPVKRFTANYKITLSLIATTNLAMIVWQTLSAAREQLFSMSAPINILWVILLAIGQHLFYLALNFIPIVYIWKVPPPEAVALGIMSSQKSAPVAVTLISYIAKSSSTQGLLSIPAIIGQIIQIFMGSALARLLLPKVKRWKAEHGDLSARPEPKPEEQSPLEIPSTAPAQTPDPVLSTPSPT